MNGIFRRKAFTQDDTDNEQDDKHDKNMISTIKLMINMTKRLIKVLET